MKRSLILVAIVLAACVASVLGQSASVVPGDLYALDGTWTGTLTYLDYSSGKKTSIKSDLRVGRMEGEAGAWSFEYIYPDEPKANGTSVVKLSPDGRILNDQAVLKREKLPDGTIKIVTTKTGTDNDKKALFRFTYLIAPSSFSILKEVKVEGADQFFERNTYRWAR